MDLKISNNLFLGLQELEHLKQSLKKDGYERLFKQMISSYGVVRPFEDNEFTNLEIVSSGLGNITLRAGIAIDSELNAIQIDQDQTAIINVPNDQVERNVIISYRETVLEEGTINIQQDGTIVGVETEFVKKLRGLPNFPSKIVFPLSENNTKEYTIQAVQNDNVATLNVVGSELVAESNQAYSVVGTFTAGIAIPTIDKFPLIRDGYQIELREESELIQGKEFVLATVTRNGTIVNVEDKRLDNIFNFLTQDVQATNSSEFESENIACTEVKFKPSAGAVDSSDVRVEWGVRSVSWSVNPTTRRLRIFDGKGGSWDDFSEFTAGDFQGQYVVFENGQSCEILESQLIDGDIELELEYQSSYLSDGAIRIGPAGLIELRVVNKSKNVTFEKIVPGFAGFAQIQLPPGTYNIKYRLIDDRQITSFRNVKENSYLGEKSFNDNGFLITGSEVNKFSTDGDVEVTVADNSLFKLLNSIVFPGVVWDYSGDIANIPSGWVLCNGQQINAPGSIYNGQNAPDIQGKVTVGQKSSDSDFDTVKESGGEKSHTLTEDEMPTHSHEGNTNRAGNHSHDGFAVGPYDGAELSGGFDGGPNLFRQRPIQVNNNGEHEHTLSIENKGGGQSHNNLQPYIVMYKIMKL